MTGPWAWWRARRAKRRRELDAAMRGLNHVWNPATLSCSCGAYVESSNIRKIAHQVNWRRLQDERARGRGDVCLIYGCTSDEIDQRGPIFLRDGGMHKACVEHWKAIFRILGEQAGWERQDAMHSTTTMLDEVQVDAAMRRHPAGKKKGDPDAR
jgi:hypothetical protein